MRFLRNVFIIFFILISCQIQSEAQQWKWAHKSKFSGPNPGAINGAGMVVNSKGDIYVATTIGYGFNDTFYFGPYKNIQEDDSLVFLYKLDSSGNVKWQRKAAKNHSDFQSPIRLMLDKNDNVWVSGLFNGYAGDYLSFGTHLVPITKGLPSASVYNYYIAKYDANGNALFAMGINGFDNNGIKNFLGSDSSGNIYMAGAFRIDTLTIGGNTVYNSAPGSSTSDIYIIKLDNSGNVLWLRKANGTSNETPYTMTVDNAGNTYVAGKFTSPTLTFGSITLNSPDMWFFVKYDTYGSVVWAKSFNNPGNLFISCISPDNYDHLYLLGSIKNNIILGADTLIYYGPLGTEQNYYYAKCDAVTGNFIWAENLGETWKFNGIGNILFDGLGNPWLSGRYKVDNVVVGHDTLHYSVATSKADQPFFLAKTDTSGNINFTTTLPVTGSSPGICADKKGYIYHIGVLGLSYGDSAQIGPDMLVQSYSNSDLVVAKYQPAGMPDAIKNIKNEITFQVYPNPAYDEFTLTADVKEGIVEIYALSGRLMKSEKLRDGKVTISTDELTGGIYLCKLSSYNAAAVVKKIIVMR